jgi:hypothetical protein
MDVFCDQLQTLDGERGEIGENVFYVSQAVLHFHYGLILLPFSVWFIFIYLYLYFVAINNV